MNELVIWLRATALSEWVRGDPWVWPALETVHFVGMCLLMGIIGLLDFRLLGFLKRVPVPALRQLLPWGIAGFVLNLVSGVLFFVGAPDQYIRNPAFYAKMIFLVIAGLNALAFETRWGSRVMEMEEFEVPPASFKVAGVLSIFSWLDRKSHV